MEPVLLAAVVLFAGAYAFINGFHDVSNSIATSVRTRALTPTVAVVLASVFNLTGALLSTALALVLADRFIQLPDGTPGLGILIAGLLAACGWGLWTWWRRMPSSSTHALVGGIVGSGAASTLVGGPNIAESYQVLLQQIVLPLLLSPVVAFVLAYLLVFPTTWLMRYSSPRRGDAGNRIAQSVFTSAFSLGHGMQDGQRTMAVIVLALVAAGYSGSAGIPLWVQVFSGAALAAGSLFGGWRISRTLSSRLVRIDPLRGMSATAVSSTMLFLGAVWLQIPLSSTQTMTSAIVGAGANQRFSTVRFIPLREVLATWLATAPVTALLGGILFLAISPML
ncbi:inorganic phosphate transporter [Arthrobacter gengyunqii]|uniref:Inorganic phosphate transporter n=1 Tax=Arthrobacter gengyunqii TaxID=2886940 RepID=A0A9X1M1G3_9MICC|nr:inorganic phosphate transporter [Arthrobacter gengyunqii]MCC3266244.1 inorganic phosphate transporter [Arthrobacter gengyunqii]MCC3268957.1 inorganic phosphate transporter [Arthrobacter gengyunqii]UOY96334.1 inorganic phosphate transporter [Arthrobacter gengyunqii]